MGQELVGIAEGVMRAAGEMRKQAREVAARAGVLAGMAESLALDVGTMLEKLRAVEVPVVPLEFVVYGQRDPRWAGRRLGRKETLGSAGCAVCCAAMVATAAGCAVSPPVLLDWLEENGGLAGADGDVLRWEMVAGFCEGLVWREWVDWSAVAADVGEIKRLLAEGPVIAEVDFDYTDRDIDQHFVVLLEWSGEDEVVCADPWTGEKVGLVEQYFNPMWWVPEAGKVARVVTGLRVYECA